MRDVQAHVTQPRMTSIIVHEMKCSDLGPLREYVRIVRLIAWKENVR